MGVGNSVRLTEWVTHWPLTAALALPAPLSPPPPSSLLPLSPSSSPLLLSSFSPSPRCTSGAWVPEVTLQFPSPSVLWLGHLPSPTYILSGLLLEFISITGHTIASGREEKPIPSMQEWSGGLSRPSTGHLRAPPKQAGSPLPRGPSPSPTPPPCTLCFCPEHLSILSILVPLVQETIPSARESDLCSSVDRDSLGACRAQARGSLSIDFLRLLLLLPAQPPTPHLGQSQP